MTEGRSSGFAIRALAPRGQGQHRDRHRAQHDRRLHAGQNGRAYPLICVGPARQRVNEDGEARAGSVGEGRRSSKASWIPRSRTRSCNSERSPCRDVPFASTISRRAAHTPSAVRRTGRLIGPQDGAGSSRRAASARRSARRTSRGETSSMNARRPSVGPMMAVGVSSRLGLRAGATVRRTRSRCPARSSRTVPA